MEFTPPVPVCKCLLLCRRIITDAQTGELLLLGPTPEVHGVVFPMNVDLAVFARWTGVQGSYIVELQLQDLEGKVLWHHREETALENYDPLKVCNLTLHRMRIFFSRPGKFEIVMLANGVEVARDVFFAHMLSPPPGRPEFRS